MMEMRYVGWRAKTEGNDRERQRIVVKVCGASVCVCVCVCVSVLVDCTKEKTLILWRCN